MSVQYGFRENRSTVTALMEFIEEITNKIDKKYAVGILKDSKKAFNTMIAIFYSVKWKGRVLEALC